MIQRIQTIWLLLVAICASLAFFIPFQTSFVSELGTEIVEGVGVTAKDNHLVALFIFNIVLCALIALFSYKKRSIQKAFTIIAFLHTLVCIGFMLYLTFGNNSSSINMGIAAPVLSLVFSILAYQGINKDDKLVKNLDRIR